MENAHLKPNWKVQFRCQINQPRQAITECLTSFLNLQNIDIFLMVTTSRLISRSDSDG